MICAKPLVARAAYPAGRPVEEPSRHGHGRAFALEQVEVVEFQAAGTIEVFLRHAVQTLHPADGARRRFDGEDVDPAVGQRLPSSGEVGHVIHDQHAARHRPGGLQLAIGHDAFLQGSRTQSPHQAAVVGSQAINPAALGTEQAQPAMDRRRRIDPSIGREGPCRAAGRRIEGHNLVNVGPRYENHAVGRHRRTDRPANEIVAPPIVGDYALGPAAPRGGPKDFERMRDRSGCAAAPQGVVAVTRPLACQVFGRDYLAPWRARPEV